MSDLGLTDKKGRKIEIGDIVKWEDEEGTRIAEVKIIDGEIVFYCFKNSKPNWAIGHNFELKNFIYSDTENHLTIIKKRKKQNE